MTHSFQEGDIVNVNDSFAATAKVVQVYGDLLQVEFCYDSDVKVWVKPSDISGAEQ